MAMIRHRVEYEQSIALTIRVLDGHIARCTAPIVSLRQQPRQIRSTRLVADILEAANRVLLRDGARRFTTARVAATAGISVGSPYRSFRRLSRLPLPS